MAEDLLEREVPEVRVDVQDAFHPLEAQRGRRLFRGPDQLRQPHLLVRVALVDLDRAVDLIDEAAVIEVALGVLEEVGQELGVEALLEHVGPEGLAVEDDVGVRAARGRDAGAAGHLAGDHLEQHRAVLRAVVELELGEPPELLAFLGLRGAEREAGAAFGDLPEAARGALELDRAFLEGDAAGLGDGQRDVVPRVLGELVDVLLGDGQLQFRDDAAEEGVGRGVDGRGLRDDQRRQVLGVRRGEADEEEGEEQARFIHGRRGGLTMPASPRGGNWIGLGER